MLRTLHQPATSTPSGRSQGGTYSQFDEDVWIARLVRLLPGIHRTFVEIGCGDGSENNTRLLLENGWDGLWVDANPQNVAKARLINGSYRGGPAVYCNRITVENVVELRWPINIGVLSIDVDGNDFHLWKRIHTCRESGYEAQIVIIEAQIQKPYDEPYVMPYSKDWIWPDNPKTEDYNWGASVCSMIELGKELGYTYVGKPENRHSPNLFFVRSDLLDKRHESHPAYSLGN